MVGDENPPTADRRPVQSPAMTAITNRGVSTDRFPGFNGLRAMAALAVLVTHVADAGGAEAGQERLLEIDVTVAVVALELGVVADVLAEQDPVRVAA